jgi:hypothetical protein
MEITPIWRTAGSPPVGSPLPKVAVDLVVPAEGDGMAGSMSLACASAGSFGMLKPVSSASFWPDIRPEMRRHPAPRADLFGDLLKKADEAVWDVFQGRKERIWSPDRRPADQRGPFDFSQSTLSWGREGCAIDDEDPVKGCGQISEEVAASLRAVAETPSDAVTYEDDMRLLADGRGGLAGEFSGKMAMYAQVPGNPTARETSGRELAELCFAKYGRYHDCTILRNKVGGDRWQVAFNIYGPCLGQRSFGYTEEQYLAKLDRTALMLNSWDQAWYVKQFLTQPIAPRAGLPSRPRPDSAVTLRLNMSPNWRDVDQDEVNSWFELTSG